MRRPLGVNPRSCVSWFVVPSPSATLPSAVLLRRCAPRCTLGSVQSSAAISVTGSLGRPSFRSATALEPSQTTQSPGLGGEGRIDDQDFKDQVSGNASRYLWSIATAFTRPRWGSSRSCAAARTLHRCAKGRRAPPTASSPRPRSPGISCACRACTVSSRTVSSRSPCRGG